MQGYDATVSDLPEQRLFSPLMFGTDEGVRRTTSVLFRLLCSLAVGAFMICIAALIYHWPRVVVIAGTNVVVHVGLILLLRAGYLRTTTIALVITVWVTGTFSVVQGDGVRDVGILIYPILLIVGALLFKLPAFVVLTLLSIGTIGVLGVLEGYGHFATKLEHPIQVPDVLIAMVLIAVSGVMVRLLAANSMELLYRAYDTERTYRQIYNATDEAIFLHDGQTGEILDVNDRVLDMYGYERDEMPRQTISDLSADGEDYSQEVALRRVKAAVDDGPQLFEWLAKRKDGSVFFVEVSLHKSDIKGRTRILAVVRDVDERKRMEQQLIQSEKLRVVGQLVSGVAHDFNNQLSGIIGFAELAKLREGGETELGSYIDEIIRCAQASADLTNQLLTFARKRNFTRTCVDLHKVIDDVLRILKRSIDKRIKLSTDLKAETPFCEGDEVRLQNALLNLGINARDAMKQGGELTFATAMADIDEQGAARLVQDIEPGRYVSIKVIDTGVGIPADQLDRIFEPFYTTKRRGEGTGMGLATVHGTVLGHDGAITVESEEGKGSTCTIFLPMKVDAAVQDAESLPTVPQGVGHILVVDDEEFVRASVSGMLRGLGYDTSTCADGSEAVEVFREKHDSIRSRDSRHGDARNERGRGLSRNEDDRSRRGGSRGVRIQC